MGRAGILLLALALSACTEAPGGVVREAAMVSKTLPPDRTVDCLNLALVDDKCTADWYKCRGADDADQSCVRAWSACCVLPGQGTRSKLGAVQTLSRD
ncbi:MAG: hypothetical protein K8S25_16375 [Alphaproteobacteria bacterium]|nr:hypothetical protein [Alphaproteobacteria bacterium]